MRPWLSHNAQEKSPLSPREHFFFIHQPVKDGTYFKDSQNPSQNIDGVHFLPDKTAQILLSCSFISSRNPIDIKLESHWPLYVLFCCLFLSNPPAFHSPFGSNLECGKVNSESAGNAGGQEDQPTDLAPINCVPRT